MSKNGEAIQTELMELEAKPQMPEAPASLNIRFSMNQFECLLTIRELDGNSFVAASKLVSGLPKVLEALYKKGAQPIFGKNGPPKAETKEPEDEEHPLQKPCPIHGVMMDRRESKSGGYFYSHNMGKGPDGKTIWCNGKE